MGRHANPRGIRSEKIDQTKPASIVINKAGGLANFCREYQYSASTVWTWLEGGFVPARSRLTPIGNVSNQKWILHRAAELRHPISAADFVEAEAAR